MSFASRSKRVASALLFLAGGWVFLCASSATAQPAIGREDSDERLPPRLEETLAREGLRFVGGYWICTEEVLLRHELDEIPKLERAFYKQRDVVRQKIRRFDSLEKSKKQLEKTVKENQQRISSGQLNALERQELQDQNRRHAQSISKVLEEIRTKLDGRKQDSPLTQEVKRLTGRQNRLAAVLLSAGQRQEKLADCYETLREDKTVADCLESLPPDQKLGPIEDYASRDRRRLAQIAKAVLTPEVPCFLLGDGYRVGVIINEETPATFTYQAIEATENNPTLIPASLAQAANLNIPPDAPVVTLKQKLSEGERSIMLRRVTIPSLRIGETVLSEVEAYVMSPEGEDLGARLSPTALRGYSVQIDPRRLTLQLKNEDPK